MTEQPTALRLADRLEGRWALHPDMQEAAAELRRLSAENDLLASAADKLRMSHSEERMELLRQQSQATAQRDALLEALKELTGHTNERFTGGVWDRARAAIKAVEENT